MPCEHDLAEMETASGADGLCPLCLAQERARLSAGLTAIATAPKTVGSGVLRSVAYDIAFNRIDGETAEFQIKRRAGLVRGHSSRSKSEEP